MMTPRSRLISAVAALLVQGLFFYALILGLSVPLSVIVDDGLKLFTVGPTPPPPPIVRIEPKPKVSTRPEGAASPPNLRSTATEIVAPKPIIPPPKPPPIVAALKAGIGNDATSGASDIVGPGTGSGGIGDGTGSGGAGDGDGDGGSAIPPRRTKGRIKDSDYPAGAGDAGIGGTVGVEYVVGVDGRAHECDITRSSGSRELDALTCRLIEERFRFKPSRDGRGRPVPSILIENHTWVVHNEPGEER